MESSLKRRDPMQQQQPPQTDSDAENNISGGDRLISPCKRLRLHDTPDKTVTFADQTNRQDAPGAPRRCGSADGIIPVKPTPDQNSPDTSVTPATNTREKCEPSTNFALENSQLSGNTQENSAAPTDEARVENASCCSPEGSPVQSPVFTPEKSLAFGAEEEQEDVDGHDSPGTPQHPIPNNTPEKSDDLDDHSDVDDIFVNGAASEASGHYDFNPTSGNSVTFADRTNVNGVHFEEETSRLPGPSCSERSVTFADQTNTNGARRRTDPPHRSMNPSVLKKERDQEPFPSERADNPTPQLCSEPLGLVPFSESMAGPPVLQRRLRFNSAGNLLCPEELDHHRLSLQSYGSLAQFGSHGRHRRRVCSSGSSYLDAQQAPYDDAPAAVAAVPLVPQGSHRRHFTASGSEGSLLRPQNLDHRFIQAQQLAGPSQGRLVEYGSVDGPGRLVDYGSIDDLQGKTRHRRDQGGLVGYGSVDVLAGFPRQARDSGQIGYGHYGGVDVWAKEPQHRDSTQGRLWYYGSIDDPRRLTSSLQSVQPASQRGQVFEESQHHAGGSSKGQSNLVRQGSEQTFVRSASRRTLPRLGSQGTEGKLGRSVSHGSVRHHGHQEPAGRVGDSGSHQSAPHQNQQHDFAADKSGHPGYTNHPGGAKNSRGSLCVLTNSGNQGSVVHGHDRPGPVAHPALANNGYHTHHQAGTAGLFGNAGQLGVFKHSDLHADAHRIRSGSPGSTDSHGRSAGSQRSVESQGRSVGSQRSVESQGRSVGSQRSVESQGRSVGSRRSSESQGRSVGSQRSSESHGREVGTGSQQSVDSRGNPRASQRPEEAYPADAALAEASKKRKVLETPGQLKVSAYLNCGLVTVHVIEGRYFTCTWKPVCDSYIKLSLIPEEGGRKMRLKSKPVVNTNNPVFDEKFSLELQKSDESKRLLVSIWHKDLRSGCSEFLGCMSFGVKGILRNKEVNGWYYLLTEDVGKKKHLEVASRSKGSLKVRAHNIPQINRDVLGLDSVTIRLERGKNGFGFTVVDEFPVKVGRVDLASPAEEAGLKAGDFIIKVNNQNVSRSTVNSVAKLVKKSGETLLLHVNRPQPTPEPREPSEPLQSSERLEPSVWRRPDPIYESIPEEVTQEGTEFADNDKENEVSMDTHFEMSSVYQPFTQAKLSASTPLPSHDAKHAQLTVQTSSSADQKKLEAIHRLMSLELDFIDFMQLGIRRYSRPLRHCIFNAVQHNTVFQNVEKLVNISEYHIQQMQENAPSLYPESDDDSQSSEDRHFASAVAMIYYSKVHMFCQAHEAYAAGLSEANRVLSDMRQHEEFLHFIKEPPLEPGQPSISAFIFRPLQHIKELSSVFQEIFVNTPSSSIDHATLKQVTHVLQESVHIISNMSNARVQSLTSLTSHTKSSSSGKGSCATSSVASSRADSGSESGHARKNRDGPKPPASLQTGRLVDREVMKMQDRLVFSENVPVFQLCQEDRHIIYQGELFYLHNKSWSKIQMVLFSDMLLLCRPDKDGSLHVLSDPVVLQDICQIETHKKHTTELVLRTCPTSPCTGIPTTQRMVFRTPTPEDLSTWRNLLEHRVKSAHGNAVTDNQCPPGDISFSSSVV